MASALLSLIATQGQMLTQTSFRSRPVLAQFVQIGGCHMVDGPVDGPHRVPDHTIRYLGGQAHQLFPEGCYPDRNFCPVGRGGLQHRFETRREVGSFIRRQAQMRARLDMADGSHGVAKMGQGFDLGRAEDARCPAGNAAAQTQHGPALADAIQIHDRHGGFHGAAGGGNGDAGAEHQLAGDGARCCQRHERRSVYLGGEGALEAEAFILLRQAGELRCRQYRKNRPEFSWFADGVGLVHGMVSLPCWPARVEQLT